MLTSAILAIVFSGLFMARSAAAAPAATGAPAATAGPAAAVVPAGMAEGLAFVLRL